MKIKLLFIIILFISCKKEQKTLSINETKYEDSQLEVYDFDGIKTFLNFEDDKTYVVNFWATWCVPCVKELPYFENLKSNYKDKNVEVVLISLDFPDKYDSQLKPFIKEHNLQSKVIALNDVDSNRWIPLVDESWSGAIPATVIYNKKTRKFYEKSFTYDELKYEVEQFLK